eukprot:gene6510-13143_t
MVALQVLSAIGAAIASPAIWFLWNSVPIRRQRLKIFLQQPILNFPLSNSDNYYLQKTSLGIDIESSLVSSCGGVKLIWAPPGAGKTVIVRHILKELQDANKIRGAFFISPPDTYRKPSQWFRSSLQDVFGNLLNPSEKLSDLLPKFDGRPFVFVVDQMDNAPMDNEMRVFMKTLAEDSHLTKSYTVLAICSDASNAKTIWEWNGHEKIILLSDRSGRSPTAYRWEKEDIERWFVGFQDAFPSSLLQGMTSSLRDRVKELAVTAGTPGFLVEMVFPTDINSTNDEWTKRAKYKHELWKIGEQMLEY